MPPCEGGGGGEKRRTVKTLGPSGVRPRCQSADDVFWCWESFVWTGQIASDYGESSGLADRPTVRCCSRSPKPALRCLVRSFFFFFLHKAFIKALVRLHEHNLRV